MQEQITKVLAKHKVWQFSLFISVSLLALGFTGETPFSGAELREGKSSEAIYAGIAFFIGTVLLLYLPPPPHDRREGDDKEED